MHYQRVLVCKINQNKVSIKHEVVSRQYATKLKHFFAAQRLPEWIISDNGPQFTASESKEFCNSCGIAHSTIASYHLRSNGEVERLVETFKNSTDKANPSSDEQLQNYMIKLLPRY